MSTNKHNYFGWKIWFNLADLPHADWILALTDFLIGDNSLNLVAGHTYTNSITTTNSKNTQGKRCALVIVNIL